MNRLLLVNIERSRDKCLNPSIITLSNQELDILALNETRLDDMLSDDLMSVHNYDLIRTDRNRQGGGVCLYIRSNLNYLNRNDSIPATLEAVCVEIHKPISQPFIVASIYRSPSASSQYISMIESFIDKLDSEGKEIIVHCKFQGVKIAPKYGVTCLSNERPDFFGRFLPLSNGVIFTPLLRSNFYSI